MSSVVGKLVQLGARGEVARSFDVADKELVIGRQNGCDVHLKYAAISRRHATLALQEGGSVLLRNMSKTNPVMLNGAGVTADGAMLKDGDEVVFPQGESERLVFRYQLVAAAAAAAKAFSPAAPPRSPLGERNNGVVAAKSPVSKKAATPEKKAAATPSKSPAKKAPTPAKSPAKKAPTPAKSPAKKAATPAKSPAKKAPTPKSAGPTPHTRAARALVADAVESLVAAEAAEAVEAAAESPAAKSPAAKSPAAKSPSVSAKKSPAARKAATPKSAGPTPHTAASRALVDAAIENLTAAEQAESAVLAASPVAATKSPAKKAPTPAKSPKAATPAKSPAKKAPTPKSAGPTPHTRAARALVADAVESLVAAEAAEAVEAAAESPAAKSPAAKSPAAKSPASGPTPHTRAARDIVAAAVAAVVADEADVAMAEASPAKSPAKKRKAAVGFASPAKSPGIPKSPRPSLKAPEMRIGAVPPGSAQRRKSLRFVADADMEQVRFIPPHNGEPELCGRIAPNQHVSLEKRKRTPNKRYADAEEEADKEMPDAAVNRVGDVGHTGPIPKFTAVVAEEAAASPKSGGRKRSLPLSSPLSTGGSMRAAVSFTIGQAEVTDDVAGTPVEQKALRAGSGCAKRKGTPAPPSRAEEEEEEEEEEEALLEENVDVTVVEEGILGSGRSDAAPSSVAGTEHFASEAAGDTADDIPVFRLGDVGNTGPIPHYSPACKASPSVVAKPLSAIKSPGCIEADSENAFRSEKAFPASASENTPRSLRRSRRSSAGARSTPGSVAGATPGTAPRPAAPANTPATGAGVTFGNALLAGLEGYAEKLARTPGGHAELGAVARILVDEADDEADDEEKEIAVNVTVEEEIEGATEFVLEAEAAAAIEAAEAAAEAGAAAAAEAEGDDFDFDEAFAADAALVAEGVADVEAVAEIEAALEKTKTPEKVAAWLEANLAEVEVEMAAKSPETAAAKSPRSKSPKSAAAKSPAAKSPMNVLPRDSPALEIIRARGGVAGGRAYGGLSARVAQLHRALRVTRAALLRERQRSKSFKKLYLKAAAQATAANEAAAIAATEVAKATEAAVEAANAPKEVIKLELNVVERKATPAKCEATPAKKAAASPAPSTRSPAPSTPTDAPIVAEDDEDEKCKVCGCNDERVAVICDDCDAVYHLGCLKPKLRKVPVGDWFCPPCADKRKPKRGRAKKEEVKEEVKEEAAPAAKRTRRAAAAPKPAAEPAVATRRSTRNRK